MDDMNPNTGAENKDEDAPTTDAPTEGGEESTEETTE